MLLETQNLFCLASLILPVTFVKLNVTLHASLHLQIKKYVKYSETNLNDRP